MAEQGTFVVLPGCTAGWTAEVYRAFGPLEDEVAFEDRAFSFRASLLNGMAVAQEELVRYRISDQSLSEVEAGFGGAGMGNFQAKIQFRRKRARNVLGMYRGMLRDLVVAVEQGMVDAEQARRLEGVIRGKLEESETTLNWWDLGSWRRRGRCMVRRCGAR